MFRNILPLVLAAVTLVTATAGSIVLPAALLIAVGAGLAAAVIAWA